MATAIGGDWPTLLDVTKRTDPDGGLATIVELLTQSNPILADAPWLEGNLPTGHQATIRTGLPDVYYRRINQGVPASKSSTAQVVETAAILEAFAQIDERQVALNGGVGSQWMQSESVAFIQAMNQQLAETLFYGSSSLVPEEFTGLAVRYSSLSATSGENILDAGGLSTDNTSIYLVDWGPLNAHMIYPKGGKGAISHNYLGVQSVLDDSGNTFRAHQTQWGMNPGFCVPDWRHCARIANIDVSNLVAESGAADILKLMTKAVHKIPDENQGRMAFYCNRTVFTMLDIQAQQKSNVYLTVGNEEGKPKVSFRGVPIRRCDKIVDDESRVT